jgi:lysophospholipase L1-like esterase
MIQQIQYFLVGLLTLPILPFLFIQAMISKKKVGTLPDAIDPVGTIMGQSPKLFALVLGESTVAGVGVTRHEEGMTGSIGKALAGMTGREVEWTAVGGSGYTARKVEELLVDQIPDKPFQMVFIVLGGNDTFELNSPLRWRSDLLNLVKSIRTKLPAAMIIIANMPPVASFTAFPKTLQWYLGGLVNLHRKVIMDLPGSVENLEYLSEPIDFDRWRKKAGRNVPMKEFFSDGVHPSALTYGLWGEQIAERACENLKA